MESIVIEGILKKNTKGRCYLVFHDRRNGLKILKIGGSVDLPGGMTIRIIGGVRDNLLIPEKIIPHTYPRRKNAVITRSNAK